MACFSPLLAWQLESGEIIFHERSKKTLRELKLPCGQCIGCRLERSRQWAMRCMHEASLHDFNVFVTLTYSDENVPISLDHRDFQLFMKRLRKLKPDVRYYMCGEYGEQFSRPHFHACLFNCFFEDREYYRDLPSGSHLWRSKTLENLWPLGYSSIGDVTFESAAYVARYVMKKVTGNAAEAHYSACDRYTGEIVQRVPEYTRMSLKPGIGYEWFRRYREEVYPRDFVVLRGMKMKPPKAYDKLLKAAPDLTSDEVELLRYNKAAKFVDDTTVERLAVREECAKARVKLKSRSL